ncbi:CueP family metal-binding protein [Nocardioides solisilvae]|uniref:CueP family metal-binding protein n=1 Tax=Nocardioides solisilvae TaxID=1542435 RepID=UPI000D750AD0|nr:CueP family metal-binding protein [Nocardioides solisilvae]
MTRLLALMLLVAALLAGCGTDEPQDRAAGSAQSPPGAAADALLAEHGLDGMEAVEIVDHLDRMPVAARPTDLMASVRPDVLVLSADGTEVGMELPEDEFYLSFAPWVEETHDCFHHSLTTCRGELRSEQLEVRIVDETHDEVLVDEVLTSFDNGFVGVWLPRDIEATLRVDHDGRVGETRISTDVEAPTCLTTLRLA